MLELDVHNADGKKVDSLRIDEAVFGGEVNRPLLREAILMHRANSRTGTASAKNRVAVHGTQRKPFRQKGTGRARQGTMVAPHHRGGGVAHGPQPRSFRYSIPKKARLAALKSAYLDRLQAATHVLDDLKLDEPKTGAVARILKNLGVQGTCLVATLNTADPVVKSVRNLPGVRIKRIRDVNAHDLLSPRDFVVTRRALESIVERFQGEDTETDGGS